MRFRFLFAIVAVSLFGAGASLFGQQSAEAEIDAIIAKIKVEADRIAAMEKAEIDPATAAYVRQIQQLRDTAQARGNLDAVLELDGALKAVQAGSPPTATKLTAAQLQPLTASFDRSMATITKKYDPARARLDTEFQRLMTDLEQRFTRGSNLEAALKVREAKQNGMPGTGVDILREMKGSTERQEGMTVLKPRSDIKTEATYKPPIEIQYELKTDGEVRISYAADQIIFNWVDRRTELRIDGGPANKQHLPGKGAIPTGKLMTIRQVVLPKKMTVYVDGEERASWNGDFSKVNQAIRIFPYGETVYVKKVFVKKLR